MLMLQLPKIFLKVINMPDELLDIVNDEDLIIDRQMRSTAHQLGLQHRGVHVFLFTPDGKMLVQKRSADRVTSPSMLDCSVSEHVRAGENYLDAAIRGMKEEMGITGVDVRPLVKFRMSYGVNDNEISVLYEGTIDSALVLFDPIEVESIQYLKMDELKEMLKDANIKFCGWFIEILSWYWDRKGRMKIMSGRLI
jgi:isopentenyl-diphosphate delta-isomerase type 1